MNLAILWRLFVARLLLPSMRSAGASSARLLIMIRGPNFSQLLLIILSSAAMVCSWPGLACDTSIVNFFINLKAPYIVLENCG